jgi:hypothetical protein
MKRYLILCLTLSIFCGCVSVNLTHYNKPTVVFSKIAVENEKERFIKEYEINDKESFKEIEETAVYRLNKTLDIRNKIIDSLKIPLNKLTVIDYTSHDASGNYEINYFFYEDITYLKYFSRANPSISLETMDKLEKVNSELYKIYKSSILNFNENLSLKSSDGPIETYSITKIVDNKVEYYVINSLDYKVKRLSNKKLLPL